METSEWKFARIVVEIAHIVVSFDVARVTLEREGKVVERFRYVSLFEVDDCQVAVGLSHIVPFSNSLQITIRRLPIPLFVQQQCFFEGSEQTRQPANFSAEKIQLPLELGLNLADALALRPQFSHSPELRERV